MLLDIKRYITLRGRVSLRDLALHFDADPEALRGMLEKWISKGHLVKCDAIDCGGCASSCPSAREEAYEWVVAARVVAPR